MERAEFKNILIEFYPKFYTQVTGNTKYKFKLDPKKDNTFDNFIDYIDEKIGLNSVGEQFITQYYKYAFGSCIGKTSPWGENKFPLNWIIAKAALDRFLKLSAYEKYRKSKKLLSQGNAKAVIKSTKALKEENKERVLYFAEVNSTEESEKKRYFNTEKGKLWCIDFTTLYNPGSSFCTTCKHSVNCTELLKKYYPKMYKVRLDGDR